MFFLLFFQLHPLQKKKQKKKKQTYGHCQTVFFYSAHLCLLLKLDGYALTLPSQVKQSITAQKQQKGCILVKVTLVPPVLFDKFTVVSGE